MRRARARPRCPASPSVPLTRRCVFFSVSLFFFFFFFFFCSGRFLADDYFTILHGEQWAFSAGSLEKEVFRPGDMHSMPAGTAKQYRMPDECWALEYARGNIVSMLPFGLGDTLSSTLDLVTLYQTLRVATAGVFQNLARSLRT